MSHTEQSSADNAPTEVTESPKAKRKSHKGLIIFLIIAGIFLVVPLFVAGWLGFVPGLSTVMGANKPRDLGVRYTSADFETYKEVTGITFKDFATAPANPDDPSKKVVFTDPKTVTNLNVTQEQLTAAINSSGWSWMPIKNAQVRLSNNTVEVSGNLNLEHMAQFVNFVGGVGYDQASVDQATAWGKKFASNAAVYLKANASVQNDKLAFSLVEVQVGRFSVPMDIANKVLSTGTTNAITRTQGLEAISAKPVTGALQFTGTYPTTVYVRQN